MTSLVLVCHAPLGQALHAVACHAFGRSITDVVAADIAANASLDEAVAAIEKLWQDEGKPTEVLLLADMLGATPSNAASAWLSLHRDLHACGLTGVSVPILLKAITYRELPAHTLAQKIVGCFAPACGELAPAG